MRTSELTDTHNDFSARSHISFQPSRFMDHIQQLPEGCVATYDEPGATFGHRDYMTKLNRMMSFTIQTFGSRLISTVWCLPMLPLMDLVGRNLLNYSVWMRDRGYGWVYKHNVNVHTGKPYKKLIMTIRFKKPFQDKPKELVEYEKMKKEFQDVNYEAMRGSMKNEEDDMASRMRMQDPNILADTIEKNPEEFVNEKGAIDAGLISAFLGVPYQKAWIAKKILAKRGLGQPQPTQPAPSNGSSPGTTQGDTEDPFVERFG
jgi:hypothetical protein